MTRLNVNMSNEHRRTFVVAILTTIVSVILAMIVYKFVLSIVLGVVIDGLVLVNAYKYNVKHALLYGLGCSIIGSLITLVGATVGASYILSIVCIFLLTPFVIIVEYNEAAKVLVLLVSMVLVIMMGTSVAHWDLALQKAQYFFIGSFLLFCCCLIVQIIVPSLLHSDTPFFINKKPICNTSREYVMMACIFAFAIALAHSIAIYYTLDFGYWIPMTVLLIFKKDENLTISRIKYRLIGTLLGAVVSVPLLFILHRYSFLHIVCIALLAYFCVIYYVNHYGYYTFFITLLVIVLYCIVIPDTYHISYHRALNTIIATMIVVFFMYVVTPLVKQSNKIIQ